MVYQPRTDRPNPQVRCVQNSCKNVQKGSSLKLVEERILQGLKEVVETFEIEANMVQLKPKTEKQISLKEKALENKFTDLEELQKQKRNLHDFLERGVYDIDTFMERQKSIVERIKNNELEVSQLKEEINKEKRQEENIIHFVPKVKDVLEAYNLTEDIESKNRLLKSVIEKATYLRKKEWKEKDKFVVQLFPKI